MLIERDEKFKLASDKSQYKILTTKHEHFAAKGMSEQEKVEVASEITQNINAMDQIHNMLFYLHHSLWKKMNNSEYVNPHEKKDFNLTYQGNYSMSRPALSKIWLANLGIFGFAYAQNASEWISVINPMIGLLAGHALCRRELRMGLTSLYVGKKDGEDVKIKTSRLGLSGMHSPLLHGVTFPPEKRDSIVQSLGPMTCVLWMIKTKGQYQTKYKDAVKKAFLHFPQIDEVITHLMTGNFRHILPLIQYMADLALTITPRAGNKAYLPPAAFSKILVEDMTITKDAAGRSIYTPGIILKGLDVSGEGLYRFYRKFQSMKWTLSGNATEDEARQIVYHCIFGTAKKSLDLLAKITNQKTWKTRSQMTHAFAHANTAGIVQEFTPIQQIFYAKMVQANQSDYYMDQNVQMSAQPVFSGETVRTLPKELFKNMACNKGVVGGGSSLCEIIDLYKTKCEQISNSIFRDDGRVKIGKIPWYKVENIDKEANPALAGPLSVASKFFLANDDQEIV